ncbi:MAG: sigma-70 family RNA polymerase sigma factor [Anaerolineales bacterium]|jgi:RNA polymerase sigma-70 factor (ECF subfamily)
MSNSQTEISIQALRNRDRREFARLVDAYSGPLHRLALKMLGNEPDADDVLQNTFLKGFQHMNEFEGRSSLSTWLYRIASNEALMMLRKRRPEITFTDTVPEDEDDNNFDPVQFTDWCCLPEEEFLTTESQAALDRAVQHLPEKLRIVFILRDIENLSIQETSQTLGLSETAVKTRLLRARLRLREELSSYFGKRLIKGAKDERR